MIKFVLLANKQGQARLVKYYDDTTCKDKRPQEIEIMKKIIPRTEKEVGGIYTHYLAFPDF